MFTTLGLLALLLAAVWCWFQMKYGRIISALSKLPPITATWPVIGNVNLFFRGHIHAMSAVFSAFGLLAVLLAAVWCWFQWKYRRLIATLSKLPPLTTSWPILGNLYLLFQGNNWLSDGMLKLMKDFGDKEEKNASFWWGPYPYIFIGRSEDVDTVLTSKKAEKSFHYDFFKIFLGDGLLTAPEDVHKTTRRHILPLFMPRNLELFYPAFNLSSRNLVRAMSEHVGRGPVDVKNMVAFYTSRTIGDLVLGPDGYFEETSEIFKKIVPKIKSTAICMAKRMATPWLWPNLIFNMFYGEEYRTSIDLWNRFHEDVHERSEKKKLEEGLCSDKSGDFKEDPGSPTYRTLPEVYELMQKNYPQFTRKELEYEVSTLFFVGSHTMAVFVSSMFVALATYPDIQERLYQEVVSVVGTEDKDVTKEDLLRMTYLEQVVKETARRFFVVPLIIRRAKDDIKLRDMTLPAGTIMVVSLITQLYDTEAYPDPQTFNPERFSLENRAKKQKHSLSPFATGSRKCVGYYYAYLLAKLMAIHVIRRFRLTTPMDMLNMKFNWDFAATSVEGYPIELHPREPARA